MISELESTDKTTKQVVEHKTIITAVIVEKTVLMTKGYDRPLIHYLCVDEEFRRQNVGTAQMKTFLQRFDYNYKEIMVVTSSPQCYRGDGSHATMTSFFYIFRFQGHDE